MRGRWGHPDEMFDELTAGQYQDWLQFHRQFNLATDKTDVFWAIHLADFRNANKGEGQSDARPVDFLPWVDQYPDEGDEAFIAAIQGFAASVGQQQESEQGQKQGPEQEPQTTPEILA